MVTLTFDKWSFDQGLQIIHADVFFSVDGETLVDEPLCIDVGLPALLLSALEDTAPDRKAPAAEWWKMPFFVCGCGDPDCRGFSFVAEHVEGGRLRLTEVEELSDGGYRTDRSFSVSRQDYANAVLPLAEHFLRFVENLDYRPYLAETVEIVLGLLDKAKLASPE